ncbi:unnamed protein product [Hermetia illucens]|uniref:Ionotropic receptor n=1 Tax=Hermetia illucens TaxID=343691 RepID=A0A7R8YP37_HERIL|nr:unnamed protein product [Hermetia illucens]
MLVYILAYFAIKGLLCQTISNYISDIESNYRFHSIVFIVPNRTVLDIFEMSNLKTPIIYLTGDLEMEVEDFLDLNNLFVVFMTNNELLSERRVFAHSKSMVRYGKVLVWNVRAEQRPDESNSQSIFELFWERYILSVIVVNWSENGPPEVLTYNPFPQMKVARVKDTQYPFERVHLNLMGYPIRSFIAQDPPRAFKYTDRYGRMVYAGYGLKIVLAFVEKHNGTFVDINANQNKESDDYLAHLLIENKEIDVTVHPYQLLTFVLSYSYPVNQDKICLMVPAAQEIPASLYNILPFEETTWYSIFASILVLLFVHSLVKLTFGKSIDLVADITDCIGIIMAITPKVDIYNQSWQSRLIFMFLAFYGVIITSLYQSTLTSLYTTKVYGKEMESAEDMMKANLTILVHKSRWYLLISFIEPPVFREQFRPVETDVIQHHWNTLDKDYGIVFIAPNRTILDIFEMNNLKTPLIFLTGDSQMKLENFLNFNNLFIVFMANNELLSESRIFAYSKSMVRYGKVLVWNVYNEHRSNKSHFQSIFKLFWERYILSVIAVNGRQNGPPEVFTYSPFPQMKVTRVENPQHPFVKLHLNLMGYLIRSFIAADPPRAFKYINRYGRTVYAGYGLKMVLAFVEKHNGTFVDINDNQNKEVDDYVTHSLIFAKEVDVTVHPYQLFTNVLSYSFPVNLDKMCLMVPAAQEIPASLYNILPFEETTWYSIFASILIFLLVHLLVKLTFGKSIDLVADIIDCIGIIMAITPKIYIYNRSWQSRLIFIFLVFYGVVITSLYQSTLTSLYTTKVYGKEMESVEDMMKANLTVMIHKSRWYLLNSFIDPPVFRKQFLPVETDVILHHWNAFDTNYGYIASSEKIEWILGVQAFSKRTLFRSPIYCFLPLAQMLGMQYLSPFEESLDRVVLQTYQAGLRDKWLEDSFDQSVEAGLVKREIMTENKYKPLIWENLEYFWLLWAGGMILSILCFSIEVCVSKMTKMSLARVSHRFSLGRSR